MKGTSNHVVEKLEKEVTLTQPLQTVLPGSDPGNFHDAVDLVDYRLRELIISHGTHLS